MGHKRINNIYDQIYTYENLLNAYRKARRNKRYRTEVLAYTARLSENLLELQEDFKTCTYHPQPYRSFTIRPVYAAEDGTVDQTQDWDGHTKTGMQSYGNMVRIKHAPYKKQTLQTRYAHLSSYCVKVGQKVKEGEIIGYSGTTGNVYGAHLHFEVILNGKRTNPLTWLDADYTLATGKEYQFNKGEHSVVVPAADTAAPKLQIPTIGPMSKGDYDALLKTAADNGSAPTLYTVTMQAMSTAAASALQQKADALGVHYTSKWVED